MAKSAAAVLLLAFLAACTFRVIPNSSEYLLRSPDATESPFSSILRNYNGFVPGQNGMDLHPGMELRIENAYYEEGMPKKGLNGFLNTEIARYIVTPKSGLRLLSSQAMTGRPADQPPARELISDTKQRFRFYRYYFEILFKTQFGNRGSVLLGSESADALRHLADRLAENPDTVCNPSAAQCVVFPEACSVSVEMQIVVNGSRQDVIWGSNLASVVTNPKYLTLLRSRAGRLIPVRLDAHDPKVLKLPLLPGDHIQRAWK